MKSRASRDRREGFVLIIVLGMVLLLSVFLFSFNYTALTRLEAAEGFEGRVQATSCAQAGLNIALAAVRDANDLSANPRFEKLRTGEATFSIGEGACSIRLVGESGRLNINQLMTKDGQPNRSRVDQFLRLIDLLNRQNPDAPRIRYSLAPALIDWMDRDTKVTRLSFISNGNQGVEDERCKNRPMSVIEELQSVEGVTPETFERLSDLLTTTGDGSININTAPQTVLECLSEQMDPTLARMILQRRKIRPFANVAELRDMPGMTDNIFQALRNAITTSPKEEHYRVYAQGRVGEHICRIEALMRRNTQTGTVDIILYRES